MKIILIVLLNSFFLVSSVFSQQADAFKLFNSKSKRVPYSKMVKAASKADVIFFGELHNDPIAHYLQISLAEDLSKISNNKLQLGAEMFESDNQEALNAYISGEIEYSQLDSLARLWPNHKTDYHPIVELAKKNKLNFVATNVPRRYASMVFRGGFEVLDGLSDQEKAWIAPMPVEYDPELPGYKAMLEMAGMHGGDNLPKAQAIKDATMAHFIAKHAQKGLPFLHLNGSYHSENYEGIIWYLKKIRPELKILTITTVQEPNPRRLQKEHRNKADFTIAVDSKMTKTY